MHIEGEDAITVINQMFAEYELSEYQPAWETLKADWERVCTDNYNFRMGVNKNAPAA